MKKQLTLTLTLAIIASSPLIAQSDADLDQSEFPQITEQPRDQGVFEGKPVSFFVKAKNGRAFQWKRNGKELMGQTNNFLIIEKAKVKDVGLYSCDVSKDIDSDPATESVPTRAASLNVYTPMAGGIIIVYGTPLLGSNTRGTCPGKYAGYINYIKSVADGWGWKPTPGTTLHKVTDTTRTNTKLVTTGRWGDGACFPTNYCTVPHPPISPSYRFSLYFPSNVPTTPYPLVMTGFDP